MDDADVLLSSYMVRLSIPMRGNEYHECRRSIQLRGKLAVIDPHEG